MTGVILSTVFPVLTIVAAAVTSDFDGTDDWAVVEISVTATALSALASSAAFETDTRLRPRILLSPESAQTSKFSRFDCLMFLPEFTCPLPLLLRSKTMGVNLYFLGAAAACLVFGACCTLAVLFVTADVDSVSLVADFSSFLLLVFTTAARFCCFSLMISSNDFTPSKSEGFWTKDTFYTLNGLSILLVLLKQTVPGATHIVLTVSDIQTTQLGFGRPFQIFIAQFVKYSLHKLYLTLFYGQYTITMSSSRRLQRNRAMPTV